MWPWRRTAVKFLHNITAAYVHYSIRWHLIWQYFYTLRWAAIEISLWAWSDVEQSQSQSYQIIGYVLMKLDIVTSLTWDLHNIDITVTWNWHYWLQTFVSHPKEHNQLHIALALTLHSIYAIILFIQNTKLLYKGSFLSAILISVSVWLHNLGKHGLRIKVSVNSRVTKGKIMTFIPTGLKYWIWCSEIDHQILSLVILLNLFEVESTIFFVRISFLGINMNIIIFQWTILDINTQASSDLTVLWC